MPAAVWAAVQAGLRDDYPQSGRLPPRLRAARAVPTTRSSASRGGVVAERPRPRPQRPEPPLRLRRLVPGYREPADHEPSRRAGRRARDRRALMTRDLSWIVLPTLNEAENIVGLLDGIGRAMPAGDYVICVVDDGSTDGTVELVRAFMRERKDVHVELLQRQKTHRGSQRGIAVWTGLQRGLQQSAADVFIEMDADLSHRPEELGTGLRLLREEGY